MIPHFLVFVLVISFVSITFAEDFKTINGKEYKNVTVSRVEPDGIVLRTNSGITKLYFAELPKEVQERFHHGSATPTGKAVTQRTDERGGVIGAFGLSDADRFAEKVAKKLDERESILQGKHTPGPAESMILREFA